MIELPGQRLGRAAVRACRDPLTATSSRSCRQSQWTADAPTILTCFAFSEQLIPSLSMGIPIPLSGAAAPGFAANGVGAVGVKIFFSISGYLVAFEPGCATPTAAALFLAAHRPDIPGAHYRRIGLAFVLGPALTTLPLSAYFSNRAILQYLWSAALNIHYVLPGVFADNTYRSAVNGSLWSIPAECLMYLRGLRRS